MYMTIVCCFTGHREICREHMVLLPGILDKRLDEIISKGKNILFKAGGAVGFDTLAALKVLEKREQYGRDRVNLELCLPCRDQTYGWRERDRRIYEYILGRADSVRYAHDKYVSSCMHDRNRMLVDGSGYCMAYCKTSRGGTAYTCAYALKKGLEFINLYDDLRHMEGSDKI